MSAGNGSPAASPPWDWDAVTRALRVITNAIGPVCIMYNENAHSNPM